MIPQPLAAGLFGVGHSPTDSGLWVKFAGEVAPDVLLAAARGADHVEHRPPDEATASLIPLRAGPGPTIGTGPCGPRGTGPRRCTARCGCRCLCWPRYWSKSNVAVTMFDPLMIWRTSLGVVTLLLPLKSGPGDVELRSSGSPPLLSPKSCGLADVYLGVPSAFEGVDAHGPWGPPTAVVDGARDGCSFHGDVQMWHPGPARSCSRAAT